AEYCKNTLEPVTQSLANLRKDISNTAEPNVLAIWRQVINTDFDRIWGFTLQDKEEAEVQKKVKHAAGCKHHKMSKGKANVAALAGGTGDSSSGIVGTKDDDSGNQNMDGGQGSNTTIDPAEPDSINEEDDNDKYW
ncbi:hypothetical protein BGZ52_006461, partial [Haplosporangium bisporale]